MANRARSQQVADDDAIMGTRDDTSLLRAIARDRDPEAFTELFERYKGRALNTAMRILKNSALAEDAVQDVMLSLWLSSKEIPQEGNASAWILRCVITRSLNLANNRRSRASREEGVALEQNKPQPAVDEYVERQELVSALSRQIEKLPELECTLLACCYGASMPHRQIGAMLNIPPRTVTYKIQQALDRLRSKLTEAHVASVVPLLSAEDLFEAVTTGYECPPGMLERIMRRIDSAGSTAAKALSRRTANARHGAWIPFAAGLVIFVGSSGALWWMGASGNPKDSSFIQLPGQPVPALPVPPLAEGASAMETPQPFHAKWSFQDGPAEDLPVFEGAWVWRKVDGKGRMDVGPQRDRHGAVVLLPTHLLQSKPYLIVVKAASPPAATSWGVAWLDQKQAIPHDTWKLLVRTEIRSISNQLYAYLLGEFVVFKLNKEVVLVHRYEKSYPADRLALHFAAWRVFEIEIHEIAAGDSVLKDLDPRKEIERIMKKGGVKELTDGQSLDWQRIPEKYR